MAIALIGEKRLLPGWACAGAGALLAVTAAALVHPGVGVFITGGTAILLSIQRDPPARGKVDNIIFGLGGVIVFLAAIWVSES